MAYHLLDILLEILMCTFARIWPHLATFTLRLAIFAWCLTISQINLALLARNLAVFTWNLVLLLQIGLFIAIKFGHSAHLCWQMRYLASIFPWPRKLGMEKWTQGIVQNSGSYLRFLQKANPLPYSTKCRSDVGSAGSQSSEPLLSLVSQHLLSSQQSQKLSMECKPIAGFRYNGFQNPTA